MALLIDRRPASLFLLAMMFSVIGICALELTAAPVRAATPVQFYVAADGNDAWSGRLAAPNKAKTDGPFASLEQARDAVRRLKAAGQLSAGANVLVRGGTYILSKTFELGAEDSGSATAPISYSNFKGEKVRLLGGKVITAFKPVTNAAILKRLDPKARGHVLQADLRALGISDYGPVSGGGIQLYFNARPMTLARWPNKGFATIADVVGNQPVDNNGLKGDRSGKIIYQGNRPSRWLGEPDAWLHGFWFFDWSDQREKIQSIDPAKHLITLAPPYATYGYRKGQWYYAFNILAELDEPGEWYVDRKAGILYFWPPSPIAGSEAIVSVLPTILNMKDVSNIRFCGMLLEAARGTAITVTGADHDEIAGCTIRNVGDWAIKMTGRDSGVTGCDIDDIGGGGISIIGGDRKTLTAANLYADNNYIHNYAQWYRTYNPAVAVDGVGNRVTHNVIHDAPHEAIAFNGNNQLIEYNEIFNVCEQTNDAGAIYGGRDWTQRGTKIRWNYLHDISGFRSHGCVGVYLDDMFSGTEISGNVFYRVTKAAFIGGGRDNSIVNNVFVDCDPAIHVDARGLGWEKDLVAGLMTTRLRAMPYKDALWSKTYPRLVNILEEDPGAPRGNVIARNILQGDRLEDIEDKAQPLLTIKDNLVGKDPRFVDAAKLDFRLRADSPAFKLGFKSIPMEKIGLYKDSRRASWPVHYAAHRIALPFEERLARRGPAPVFRVARRSAPITIDGRIQPNEWSGADIANAIVLAEDGNGDKAAPPSYAWMCYDAQNLYVAIDNDVNAKVPIRKGSHWGQDDAVEIALHNPADAAAPVFVFRGYANGHFESGIEAGAFQTAAAKAGAAVQYAARVLDAGHWSAEYKIPFAALGINPAKQRRLQCNLTVRKSAESLWLMWRGTGYYSWDAQDAGVIEFAK